MGSGVNIDVASVRPEYGSCRDAETTHNIVSLVVVYYELHEHHRATRVCVCGVRANACVWSACE